MNDAATKRADDSKLGHEGGREGRSNDKARRAEGDEAHEERPARGAGGQDRQPPQNLRLPYRAVCCHQGSPHQGGGGPQDGEVRACRRELRLHAEVNAAIAQWLQLGTLRRFFWICVASTELDVSVA